MTGRKRALLAHFQSNTVTTSKSFHFPPDLIFGVVPPTYSRTLFGSFFSIVKNSGSINAAITGLVACILMITTLRPSQVVSDSFRKQKPTVSLRGTTIYRHFTSRPLTSASQCDRRKGPTMSLISVSFCKGSLSVFGFAPDAASLEYSKQIRPLPP